MPSGKAEREEDRGRYVAVATEIKDVTFAIKEQDYCPLSPLISFYLLLPP